MRTFQRVQEKWKFCVDETLSIAQHTIHCSTYNTLGRITGLLVFSRGIFFNIPLLAKWNLITTHREHLVNEYVREANAKHRSFDYV